MKFWLNEYILHEGGVAHSRSRTRFNDNKFIGKRVSRERCNSFCPVMVESNHRLPTDTRVQKISAKSFGWLYKMDSKDHCRFHYV